MTDKATDLPEGWEKESLNLGNDMVIQQIMSRLYAWKEALVRRMLRHWDPAWGMPAVVEGPSTARVPLYDSMRKPWDQDPTKASISILGLADDQSEISTVPRIRVTAADHIGPDNWPLPPEGPFPLPSDAQWRAWRDSDVLVREQAYE